MKVIVDGVQGREKEVELAEAIKGALYYMDGSSTEGSLESMQTQLLSLQLTVGKLIDLLVTNKVIKLCNVRRMLKMEKDELVLSSSLEESTVRRTNSKTKTSRRR